MRLNCARVLYLDFLGRVPMLVRVEDFLTTDFTDYTDEDSRIKMHLTIFRTRTAPLSKRLLFKLSYPC
jgi:hypothetical protein